MNNISIFTPTHDPKYLIEAYDSIKNQNFYEWVILTQDCEVPKFNDNRIKIYNYHTEGEKFIGDLKLKACSYCKGDIYLELDHDDLLTSTAIEECKKAFSDPEIGFVYSNSANFSNNFIPTQKYDFNQGWLYEPFNFVINDGSIHEVDINNISNKNLDIKQLNSHLSFEPTPSSVSKIWYAPNHLRAWRKEIYWATGGHNPQLKVLDDQELIMRTYLKTKFKLINKCLYLYRIDGNNTWLKNNSDIQSGTLRLYENYIERLSLKWAEDNNFLKIELGARFNKDRRYKGVDLKDCDICCDLNDKWPLQDNSVGVIKANDIFEHLKNPLHTMKELYRVLAPGGYAFIQVPSTDGRGAFQDPLHVSYWNENSFLYYTNKNWSQYIDTPVRFQELIKYTTAKNNIGVCWAVCHLLKLTYNMKRPPGIINI